MRAQNDDARRPRRIVSTDISKVGVERDKNPRFPLTGRLDRLVQGAAQILIEDVMHIPAAHTQPITRGPG